MNKPLLIFIFLSCLLIVAAFFYSKYCKTLPEGCKYEQIDDSNFGPREGIDW